MFNLVFAHAGEMEDVLPVYLSSWEFVVTILLATAVAAGVVLSFFRLAGTSNRISLMVSYVKLTTLNFKNEKLGWRLIGLALAAVFLSHGLVATHDPGDFTELMEHSSLFSDTVGAFTTPESFITVIKVSDITLTVLFTLAFFPRLVALYAAAWLTGAAILSGPSEFLEHVAFLLLLGGYVALAIHVEKAIGLFKSRASSRKTAVRAAGAQTSGAR